MLVEEVLKGYEFVCLYLLVMYICLSTKGVVGECMWRELVHLVCMEWGGEYVLVCLFVVVLRPSNI